MTPDQFEKFIRRFDLAVECIIAANYSNDGYNYDRTLAIERYRTYRGDP